MNRRLLKFAAFFLCCSVAPWTAYSAKDQKSYTEIFKDFYDLATPHNRGHDVSWGMDAQFSAVVPFGRLGETTLSNGNTVSATYATFFNVQGKLFFRLLYHYEIFWLVGYNSIGADVPIRSASYQHATLKSFPLMIGFKYRFVRSDFVPYLSVAAGPQYVMLDVSEEKSGISHNQNSFAIGWNAAAGTEIFIQPHYGLALEVGLEYIHHGAVNLTGFNDGPFKFQSASGGLLVTSSFFYEF